MAERDLFEELPGTANPGDPSTPPSSAPPSGYEWKWITAIGQWQLVPKTVAPPPPGDPNAPPPPPGPMTREQRDVLQRGTLGNLEGFMARSSYGNDLKARNSVKNTFATIASRYPSKPSSIDKILADPDFKRLFPNAKKVGADKIDFGGVQSDFESGTPVGIIDVLTAADPNTDTARGWWWGYNAGGTGPTMYRPPVGGLSGSTPSGSGSAAPSLYDWSKFGTEALTRSPEERGWSTLAELGMTGDRANDTPEDIFKRNQAADLTEFGQAGNPGWFGSPWTGQQNTSGRLPGNQAVTGAAMFASPWGMPAMTLGTLAKGFKNTFANRGGRRVPGVL